MLMAAHVAADAIAGEQRSAAEERIARSLEVHSFLQMFHREAVRAEPSVKIGCLAGADFMAKARAEKALAIHQAGVGRENQIGQTRLRRHQLDGHTQSAKRFS